MKREQLEHVLRAASHIANDPDVVVIGSQSILGSPVLMPRGCCASEPGTTPAPPAAPPG